MTRVNTKVLIIDDEEGVRESIAMSFKGDELDLYFAENGVLGLEMIFNLKPSVIILDLKMPKMGGMDVLSKLKNSDIDPKSIIILSGHGDNKDIRECFKAGITTYIAKPFNTLILRGTVTNLIDLLDHKNNLENKVKQRTLELQNSLNRINELNRETNLFLKFLSHEMRTPLNWIGSFRELFSQKKFNNSDKEFVEMIKTGFKQLLQLNEDFISYAEFANKELELDIKNISLIKLFTDLINKNEVHLKKKQIDVSVNIHESVEVKADQKYLNRVLKIVFDNAISFSKKPGKININTKVNKNNLILEISDNGKGIKKENLKKIFKPFLIRSFDRHEKGFGLNLPKAKIITDAHGWEFRAESDGLDCGAKFFIEI